MDTDTTMPVSTRPLGIGLMYSGSKPRSPTMGATPPSIYPSEASNRKTAESMMLNPITLRSRFCCSIRFVKPMPNRMTAVTA